MTAQGRQTGSFGDELTNFLMAGLVGLFGLMLVLRGAGSVASFLTGTPQPDAGIAGGISVLFNPAAPGSALGSPETSPVIYWLVTAAMLIAIGALVSWLWTLSRHHSRKVETDPHKLAGMATAHEIAKVTSARTLLKRANILRPSLDHPSPKDVGFRIGRSRGKEIWATVEDSIMLIGPPRCGKGHNVVIPLVLDAPGAVVATSTRPDILTATMRSRQKVGPVMVFDPQRIAEGIPSGLRWSPIRGCEDPLTAMIRATGLAAATGLSDGGVDGGGFWEGKTRVALQAMLHAAAIDHRSPAELFRWTLDPSAAADAVAILHSSPRAAIGWAESLESMIDADPRTRDSIWQGVSLALAVLADPRVLDAVSPGENEALNPATFLRKKGTLYLLATGAGAGNTGALVAAFIEDIVETARRIAARSAGARLDPPLFLALDEIGNLAPLPSLPTLMSEGGGTGITTMPVLQSLSQARAKWSENEAAAIWNASIVKIVLGGAGETKDLTDLEKLLGERDEYTDSITIGEYGGRTNQRSVRRMPVMSVDQMRMLPQGTGLILLRSAPPIIADLYPWPERSDGDELLRNREELETLLRTGNDTSAPVPTPRESAES